MEAEAVGAPATALARTRAVVPRPRALRATGAPNRAAGGLTHDHYVMWSTLARLARFGHENRLLPGLVNPHKSLVRRLHLPVKTAWLQSLEPRRRCERLPR